MAADRIEIYNGEYAGLAFEFEVNPDSCINNTHYENYIRFVAISDHSSGKGTTFVYIRENDGVKKLLGFITLRATSYIRLHEDRIDGEPALEVFELAVSKDVEHTGIGSALISVAFAEADLINEEHMGVRYITVCADEKSVGFYEKMGFGKIENYGDVPRDYWNEDCVPMTVMLPSVQV